MSSTWSLGEKCREKKVRERNLAHTNLTQNSCSLVREILRFSRRFSIKTKAWPEVSPTSSWTRITPSMKQQRRGWGGGGWEEWDFCCKSCSSTTWFSNFRSFFGFLMKRNSTFFLELFDQVEAMLLHPHFHLTLL